MLDKLEAIADRYRDLELQLADPSVTTDMDRYTKISKEYKELEPLVNAYLKYQNLLGNIRTAREYIHGGDSEMAEMAEEELRELEPQLSELENNLRLMLIPKDPEDAADVFVEIRSGTGGDEASLFAGDLYKMYSRFFEDRGWKSEILSMNEGTAGGYNKIVLEVSGEHVYGMLKFESGAHRVQRVPKTESQGRVHTSAATVAVIPKLELEDVNISRADLKIDTFRSSGAGGQHVNKTESAVRITHLPTGIVSESQDGRSQIRNREIALQRLSAKVLQAQREQHQSEMAQKRRSLVGTGDRSDKVRTYNWPQNRVTDHRLEGEFKNFNLDQVMAGQLTPIIEALQMKENAEKLQEGQMAN